MESLCRRTVVALLSSHSTQSRLSWLTRWSVLFIVNVFVEFVIVRKIEGT